MGVGASQRLAQDLSEVTLHLSIDKLLQLRFEDFLNILLDNRQFLSARFRNRCLNDGERCV
jgi:hypothetical protein